MKTVPRGSNNWLHLQNFCYPSSGQQHGQLNLYALGVLLRPDEAGINKLHLLQALQLLEANGQKFAGLQRGLNPFVGRLQIALAVATEVEHRLLWDILRDVDMVAQAGDAHVGRIRLDGHSALAAQDHRVRGGALALSGAQRANASVFVIH